MKKKPRKIAIVGAGLVGSLISIYLAKRGYEVTVFEHRFDMRSHMFGGGRSINLALSNRGLRPLDEIGLAEQIKHHAVPMKGRMMHDLEGKLTFQAYGEEGQVINSISRSGLNMLLMTEAEKQGVKFLFEHRCTHYDIEKCELTFMYFNSAKHYEADFVIGADGAFSAVRHAMQVSDRFNYSQHYIEHGYKELRIPPGEGGKPLLDMNALHIWPRESFMMIALPNPDTTFTCTLFYPFEGEHSFKHLGSPESIHELFQKTFPDALPLMPSVVEDFRDNPTASLVTIRCFPWIKKNTLLMGDAAHGVVPFYGQGMNASFEDCRILNELLGQFEDRWDKALPEFQKIRKPNTDAIAQLALDNFVEMRDHVANPEFLLRKKIEARLHKLYPQQWIPLYSMVTFHDEIPYVVAQATGQMQSEIMDKVMMTPGIASKWEQLNFGEIVAQLSK